MRFIKWAPNIAKPNRIIATLTWIQYVCGKLFISARRPTQRHIYLTSKLHGQKLNNFNAPIKTIHPLFTTYQSHSIHNTHIHTYTLNASDLKPFSCQVLASVNFKLFQLAITIAMLLFVKMLRIFRTY